MRSLIVEHALLPQGWRRRVRLTWDAAGRLTAVEPDTQDEAEARWHGFALPGMTNLHSHAFQRAMAGLTEHRGVGEESFWSWRQLMYGFAARLSPEACKAIAVQLYTEMLKAGYTSVCEFHYLHHDLGGKAYAPASLLAASIIDAAQETGIGLTLLPVLYQHSGFGARAPLAEQARFINTPDWVLTLIDHLRLSHREHDGLRYGVAPHSLRAVGADALRALLAGLAPDAPVHIHIAEQQKEVDDCLAVQGARPVDWLLQNVAVDARWCLVHATHMSDEETQAVARSGAVVGLCPTTEANLGDGFFNAPAFETAQGRWGIGSDSHASVCPFEELRLLEYGQRLLRQRRNVLAPAAGGATGAHLYRAALAGGAQASGRPVQGLAVGQRADVLLFDVGHPDLAARSGDQWIDSLVFGRHAATPLREVICGGRRVVQDGRHAGEEQAASAYRNALATLLA